MGESDNHKAVRSPAVWLRTVPEASQKLTESCLFCDPADHGQSEQVLLRSDNLYLFAGLGPIVEGYIILAPYRCDAPERPLHSLSDFPPELIDEAIFLRGLVSAFYRDRCGHPGMHFEHGRTGVCLAVATDTKHCYHAHLCCYPVSFPLWEDMSGLNIKALEGMHELASRTRECPYLFVQSCEIDDERAIDEVRRETWTARVSVMDAECQIKSQYLRRLLARRVGDEYSWDWASMPQQGLVRTLVEAFRDWLSTQSRYVVTMEGSGPPRLDFLRSVSRSNQIGNDYVAEKFFQKWAGREQFGGVARFLTHLPRNESNRPRVLDGGCGTGSYTNAFFHLGIECVGIDIADEMLRIAQKLLEEAGRIYEPGRAAPAPTFIKMNASEPSFSDGSFDGIWYSAVLVHVPKAQAPRMLLALHRVLRDDGVLYVSAQIGGGAAVRWEGRIFFFYSIEELVHPFPRVRLQGSG